MQGIASLGLAQAFASLLAKAVGGVRLASLASAWRSNLKLLLIQEDCFVAA
jgi:hypothetical protein